MSSLELELKATPQEVMRAVEALQAYAHERGVPEKTIFSLALALEECGSNIVNHSLRRDAQQSFQVRIEHATDAFVIELRDRGPAFDPTALASSKAKVHDDEALGGWGLQLLHRNIDDIRYRREDKENVLHLTKRLKAPQTE